MQHAMARLAPWAALLYVIISGACAGAVGSPGAEELWAKHESCRRLQENDDAVNGCVVKSGAGEFHFVKDKETSEGMVPTKQAEGPPVRLFGLLMSIAATYRGLKLFQAVVSVCRGFCTQHGRQE